MKLVCEMSKLFTFLENLDTENEIKIYDESDLLLFEGKAGNVPQRITNTASVIGESVINAGSYIKLTIKLR